METLTHTFRTIRLLVTLYGALSTALLGTVAVLAATGHPVNTFMWVRAVLLPLVAVVIHRLTGSASRGSHRAFERVRTLAVVMPIAVIGVDLVPGVCPPWYAVTQSVCMLPVIGIAFLTRRSAPSAG